MCARDYSWMCGYRRVERQEVRLRRIHRFAAERFADAQTARGARFWWSVMAVAVRTKTDYVRDERLSKVLGYHALPPDDDQ